MGAGTDVSSQSPNGPDRASRSRSKRAERPGTSAWRRLIAFAKAAARALAPSECVLLLLPPHPASSMALAHTNARMIRAAPLRRVTHSTSAPDGTCVKDASTSSPPIGLRGSGPMARRALSPWGTPRAPALPKALSQPPPPGQSPSFTKYLHHKIRATRRTALVEKSRASFGRLEGRVIQSGRHRLSSYRAQPVACSLMSRGIGLRLVIFIARGSEEIQ